MPPAATAGSGWPQRRNGFSGYFGGSYCVSKLIGSGKARELYFAPEPLDAQHVLAIGIAKSVVLDAELNEATMAPTRLRVNRGSQSPS